MKVLRTPWTSISIPPPMPRSFSLATITEARAAIEHFNAFHDGFINHLQVVSHDRFEGPGTQQCSGRLDLVVRFAHYNYDFEHGLRLHTQEVEAAFHGVRDLVVQFSGRETEWSVKRLEITEATRAKTYPPDAQEPCLRAVLVQPRLRDWKEWLEHDDLVFTFTGGTIREIPSS